MSHTRSSFKPLFTHIGLNTHQCSKWNAHSCSLYRAAVTVGEHIKAHTAQVPNRRFVCVSVCVCLKVTGEYLKSVWSTLPEEEQSGCVLSSERKKTGCLCFFLPSSSLSCSLAAWRQQSHSEKVRKQHTLSHTNPHKHRKCFDAAKAKETVNGQNVSLYTRSGMCVCVCCWCVCVYMTKI